MNELLTDARIEQLRDFTRNGHVVVALATEVAELRKTLRQIDPTGKVRRDYEREDWECPHGLRKSERCEECEERTAANE